jgi:hypothetical protein
LTGARGDVEIETLCREYPLLYHMAEVGSWDGIRDNGLLSTSALLTRYLVKGTQRFQYESQHRPNKVTLANARLGSAVIRDQKPMSNPRLRMCLQDGLTPRDWYETLNCKVFFWVSRTRLIRLLQAREYRHLEHDVLTVRTEPLVRAYSHAILLCHMNSGNTFPIPHKRGRDTFRRIADYPVGVRSGKPRPAVVELVIEHGVPNIVQFVAAVDRMHGKRTLRHIPLR